MQLGSECNAGCPRCDSSCCDRNEPADLDVGAVAMLAREMWEHCSKVVRKKPENPHDEAIYADIRRNGLQGYICGLGEPTAGKNLVKLKELLASTEFIVTNWSMFVNGIYWDDELSRRLSEGSISVKVQYNSNKAKLVAETLGRGAAAAKKHLENRRKIQKIAQEMMLRGQSGRNGYGYTYAAASIVPDRDNIGEMKQLVRESAESWMFPLVTELENAGYAKEDGYYEEHKPEDGELRELHRWMGEEFGGPYEVPICPAVYGAVHINNRNQVTVDKFTGLSCGWFGMGDPEVHVIGDIREMSYEEIVQEIFYYRESRIAEVRRKLKGYPEMIFGGCGGNARKVLTEYTDIYYKI